MALPSTAPLPAQALLPANRAGAARAAELITQGNLVALPTETVYGIAVNLASNVARETVRHIKGPAAAPWVIHVAKPENVFEWVPGISAMGRRLVNKSLPGPVAFQFKLNETDDAAARKRLGDAADEALRDGYLNIRCPDFSVTQSILEAVSAPVAIVGAGTAAQPAVFDVSDLPPSLFASSENAPAPVAAAVDGGSTRYRKSSTVVRVEGDGYSVIRAGVIDERILHRLADLTLLFVCSGNTCRSPMAAALGGKILADKLGIAPSELPLRHIVVQSAGVHAARGMRAAMEAIETVKDYGADLAGHFSQTATPELLRRADVIYTMTESHREELLEMVPGAERKTFRLDPEGDIADPIGAGMGAYQQVALRLNEVLQSRLAELPL